jgi:hypothetical protein
MSTPKVTILYANGGILADIQALDGIVGFIGTGNTMLLQPKVVFNLSDAEEKGFTLAAEPVAHRHIKEFYQEVGGSQELHIMLVPSTMTMEEMADDTEENGAKKLITAAAGRIRLIGLFRSPDVGYDAGEEFLDADVGAALLKAKTFCEARLAELSPVRMIIEGRVANPEVVNTLEPRTYSNGYAGVVLGGSLNDGSASIGTLFGRAVKFGAHIKVGKVANGALALTTCFIGTQEVSKMQGLDALHAQGFITFMKHPQRAGFYFGIDRMASTDDYRLLAYGRVVDKAAIIAAAVYISELEGEVAVGADGNIDSLELAALRDTIEQQIIVGMGTQISGVIVNINPLQNIINTGVLNVQLRVRPLGYKTFINVDLGLTAPSNT